MWTVSPGGAGTVADSAAVVASAALEPNTVQVTGTHQRERAAGRAGWCRTAVLRATAGPDVVLGAEKMLTGNRVRLGGDLGQIG